MEQFECILKAGRKVCNILAFDRFNGGHYFFFIVRSATHHFIGKTRYGWSCKIGKCNNVDEIVIAKRF